MAPKERSTEILVLLPSTEISNRCFQWINIKMNQCQKARIECKMELNVQIITAMHCQCLSGYAIKTKHEIRPIFHAYSDAPITKGGSSTILAKYCQRTKSDNTCFKCIQHLSTMGIWRGPKARNISLYTRRALIMPKINTKGIICFNT